MPNSTSALLQCEMFCGRNSGCWGCSLQGDDSQSWEAISNSSVIIESIDGKGESLFQKRGKLYL